MMLIKQLAPEQRKARIRSQQQASAARMRIKRAALSNPRRAALRERHERMAKEFMAEFRLS